jgi:hypothetical protein
MTVEPFAALFVLVGAFASGYWLGHHRGRDDAAFRRSE